MKKYLYHIFVALFAVSSLSLVSCSDDDEEIFNNGKLVGTWENISLDDIFNGTEIGTTQYVRFEANGNYTEVNIYRMGGLTDDETEVLYGKWKLEGDKINISGCDATLMNTEILKLNDSELIINGYVIEYSYNKVADSIMDKYLQ